MTDKFKAVFDLTEKARKSKEAGDALHYSQAAVNVANAIARAEEVDTKVSGNVRS